MGAAVAVIVIKEQQVVEAFRRAGALDPGSAVSPAVIGVSDQAAFRRLRQYEVLREANSGTFYLDAQSWTSRRDQRRRLGLLLLLAVLLGALVLWMKKP